MELKLLTTHFWKHDRAGSIYFNGARQIAITQTEATNSVKVRHPMHLEHGQPPLGRAGMTLVEVLVALAITGVTLSGMVSGYIYCMTSNSKAELMQAAHAKALERLEQTRSAVWAPSRAVPQDDLVVTNFPALVVTLDLPGSATNGTQATIQTTIASISSSPPLRLVHVDCVWNFKGGEWITNSIETIRSPDQ
jgi:prepilin-type N-terminal cleavage/methylation domain-containing protein